ncbi:MAG: hypothetical protein ACYTGQ_01100 [Planctomycetota bacterium]|jgi:tetratricopeptide (TPR) repeat protein
MPAPSHFDPQAAHAYFSVECFNAAWGYIEKPNRSHEDDERMLQLALVSLWHWSRREDCTDTNLSAGYWQVSRVYAILGEPVSALKYAQHCLDVTPRDAPFFLGYAYEALARAEWIAGNDAKAKEYLAEARRIAESVTDEEERGWLVNDLGTVG